MKIIPPPDSRSRTLLSNEFIDRYMTAAPHRALLVYILLLRNAESDMSLSEMAKLLNTDEPDVFAAINYWEKNKVLSFKGDNIKFLRIDRIRSDVSQRSPMPAEIADQIETDFEFKYLLQEAARISGKELSVSEIMLFKYIYEELGMPAKVALCLKKYCVERGKHGNAYIRSMAENWMNEGINTPEAAEEYIKLYRVEYKKIMNRLGCSGAITETEEKYFKKWLREYEMPMELILNACERAVENSAKGKPRYVDKIITRWYENGIRTLEDAANDDKLRLAEFPGKEDRGIKKNIKVKNRFNDFEQRSWDFDKIEQIAQMRLEEE